MYSAARPPSSTAMRLQLFLRHQEAISVGRWMVLPSAPMTREIIEIL